MATCLAPRASRCRALPLRVADAGAAQGDAAMGRLNGMRDAGLRPDVVSYSSVIAALSRDGASSRCDPAGAPLQGEQPRATPQMNTPSSKSNIDRRCG